MPAGPSMPMHRSLRTGFRRFAEETPDATALVVRGVTRSYADLDRTARRWAGQTFAYSLVYLTVLAAALVAGANRG